MSAQVLHPTSALRQYDLNPLETRDGHDLTWTSSFKAAIATATTDPKIDKSWPKSALEILPFEILENILTYLLLDTPPASYGPRNADLVACLLVSPSLHEATLRVLYRNLTIPHSRIFSMLMRRLCDRPSLGTLVRRLDFSRYSSVGLGRTRKANQEIQNVTPKTLLQCLSQVPHLKEFLVHEHIDDELDEQVIHHLLHMPFLQAIDFCACSSPRFVQSLTAAVMLDDGAQLYQLRRLSFHECSTIQPDVFENLIQRLPNLTHLDAAHTLIEDSALEAVPSTAQLTHLNLGKCTMLSGEAVVNFMINHNASRSLQFLNLMSDPTRHRLLSSKDLEILLAALPPTLRSLNINGSELTPSCLPSLRLLATQLEELGISHNKLSIEDINSLFEQPQPQPYIPNPPNTTAASSTLRYIDLSSTSSLTRTALFSPTTHLLTAASLPLQTIELSSPGASSEDFIPAIRARYSTSTALGWTLKDSGRRSWFIRDLNTAVDFSNYHHDEDETGRRIAELERRLRNDDGSRRWKMGATRWGMRKIPVAVMDVDGGGSMSGGGGGGGMYAHYMYKA